MDNHSMGFGLHQFIMLEYNRLAEQQDSTTAKANVIATLMKEAIAIANTEPSNADKLLSITYQPAIDRIRKKLSNAEAEMSKAHYLGNEQERDRWTRTRNSLRDILEELEHDKLRMP